MSLSGFRFSSATPTVLSPAFAFAKYPEMLDDVKLSPGLISPFSLLTFAGTCPNIPTTTYLLLVLFSIPSLSGPPLPTSDGLVDTIPAMLLSAAFVHLRTELLEDTSRQTASPGCKSLSFVAKYSA